MKSVNHPGARWCAGELQTKPVQFSALPTRGSASSKLLHINLFCCSISYVNCSRPYCERRPKTKGRNALRYFRRLINIKLLKTYNMRVVLIYERRQESLFDNRTKGSPRSPMGMQKRPHLRAWEEQAGRELWITQLLCRKSQYHRCARGNCQTFGTRKKRFLAIPNILKFFFRKGRRLFVRFTPQVTRVGTLIYELEMYALSRFVLCLFYSRCFELAANHSYHRLMWCVC